MSFRRFLLISLALVFANLYSSASFSSIVQPLTYSEIQARTLVDIVGKLHSRHYRNQKVDDELSNAFLEKYLETLDPAHMFFYDEDIKSFEKYRLKFDDLFKKGDLGPSFEIYHIYRQRVISRLESALDTVRDPAIKFEFNQQDELILDRSELPWPSTRSESDELWYKRIKLSLLNLKLAGKSVEEARKTVEKRYKNQLNRIKQQDRADVFETIVNALTLLYDPHTNYWSPRTSENFNINMSLSLEGIGAVLQSEDEFTRVVRLVPGGPADKNGQLGPADRIVGVAQGDDGEIVDVVGWRLDEVVQLIRGPKNTIVKLEILPAGAGVSEDRKIVRINRGRVKLEDQAAEKAVLEIPSGNDVQKFGVIKLPTFYIDFDAYNNRDPSYRSSTKDVSKLIEQLQAENVDGIILDLRNNGGGSLHEATKLTGLFIDQGPVVQIRSIDGRINRHNRSMTKAKYRGPLIVLINRLSASASEIFAAAIQDYKRGIIVGSQSFGKGTVQSVTPLLEGRLKITESKFYRVSGDSTQHRGVLPDIEFPMLIDATEVGESAYENSLPWDQIHSVPHAEYIDLGSVIPLLDNLHKERAKTDPDFNYILDQIALVKENKSKKTVSLNEQRRVDEKEELELASMEIENKRRKAKGEDLYKNLEEYRAQELDEEKKEQQEPKKEEAKTAEAKPDEKDAKEDEEFDIEDDTLLVETGHIMSDYIRLMNKSETMQASNF